MVITWEEALEERETRGKTEGLALGKAEGQLEATRQAIVLLLDHRFGATPLPVRAKLDSIADLERLHAILEQAFDVRSLDQLDLGG